MRISPYRSSQCGSNPRVTARKARIYAAANNCRGKLFIDAREEMKKSGILQYGVAHFDGLQSW